jgi:PAT family beta-lactamase induction signal transducer AmpG
MSPAPANPVAARLGLLGALYLSQGLPYGFQTQALPSMLRTLGLSLPEIGATSLLALPWALKFLWAPLVDRWWSPTLGHRRSWILPIQLTTVGALALMGTLDPHTQLHPLLWCFLGLNLLAATQDIATDGLAIRLLGPSERGLGNGLQVAGYRVGMVFGGGLLLMLYGKLGWMGSFFSMAGVMAIATLPILAHREAPPEPRPAGVPLPGVSFWRRPGAWPWLGFLALFKLGDHFTTGMMRPWLVDLGWSLEDIGGVVGTLGFGAGMAGALLGGLLTTRLTGGRALWVLGGLQTLALASWAPIAATGANPTAVSLLVLTEHFFGGMATAALFTRMMDAADPTRAGADYSIQASTVVVATGVAATLSGISAEALGWPGHFAAGAFLSALALVPLAFTAKKGGFRIHTGT